MVGSRGCRVHVLRFSPASLGLCRASASVPMDIRAGGKKNQEKSPLLYEQNQILKALGWRSRMCLSHLTYMLVSGSSGAHFGTRAKCSRGNGHGGDSAGRDLGQPHHSWAVSGLPGKFRGAPGTVGSQAEGSCSTVGSPPTSHLPRCLGTPDASTLPWTATGMCISCLQHNSPMKQQGSCRYGPQKTGKEYSTLLAIYLKVCWRHWRQPNTFLPL